jgi:hypothetical protein
MLFPIPVTCLRLISSSWEICVGIVAACIPALHPGYKSLRGRWRDYALSRSERSGSKSSEKTLRPSHFSKPVANRKQSAAVPPVEPNKPLPATPTLPANTLRPDLRAVRAMVGTEISHDSIFLPIQDTWGSGIVKTTQVDLESQRALSGDDSEASLQPKAPGWDSRTALHGRWEGP